MNKEETFDLVVKGFGVALLVLAVHQAAIVAGVIGQFIILKTHGFATQFIDPKMADWSRATVTSLYANLFGETASLLVFISGAINLLTTGSLVRWFMKHNKKAEQSSAGDSRNPAVSRTPEK